MNSPLLTRFNATSSREKLILLLTAICIIWGAWDALVYQPLAQQKNQLSAELSSLKSELSAQEMAAVQIEANGKIDPNTVNKHKLAEINQQLTTLKQQLDIGSKRFVSAQSMAQVLQEMLQKNKRLTLVNLETLPVTDLSTLGQQKSWIFRHGLSITIQGNFFDTLNYLQSLESLTWRFNWDNINYQVKDFPTAETTFQIYTLSFEENWLGL